MEGVMLYKQSIVNNKKFLTIYLFVTLIVSTYSGYQSWPNLIHIPKWQTIHDQGTVLLQENAKELTILEEQLNILDISHPQLTTEVIHDHVLSDNPFREFFANFSFFGNLLLTPKQKAELNKLRYDYNYIEWEKLSDEYSHLKADTYLLIKKVRTSYYLVNLTVIMSFFPFPILLFVILPIIICMDALSQRYAEGIKKSKSTW